MRGPAAPRCRSQPCLSTNYTLHLRALAWSRANLTHHFSQRGDPRRSSLKAARGGAGLAFASGLHTAIQLPVLAPCAYRAARRRAGPVAGPGRVGTAARPGSTARSTPRLGRHSRSLTTPGAGLPAPHLHRHPIGQQRTRAEPLTPPFCPTLPGDAAGPAPPPRWPRPFPRPFSQLARRWEPAKALPIGYRRVAPGIGWSAKRWAGPAARIGGARRGVCSGGSGPERGAGAAAGGWGRPAARAAERRGAQHSRASVPAALPPGPGSMNRLGAGSIGGGGGGSAASAAGQYRVCGNCRKVPRQVAGGTAVSAEGQRGCSMLKVRGVRSGAVGCRELWAGRRAKCAQDEGSGLGAGGEGSGLGASGGWRCRPGVPAGLLTEPGRFVPSAFGG